MEKIRSSTTIRMNSKSILVLTLVCSAVVVAIVVSLVLLVPMVKYTKAMALFNNKDYGNSSKSFSEMGDYRDSKQMVLESDYNYANQLVGEKEYERAISILSHIENYKDSQEIKREANYLFARLKIDTKDYKAAISILKNLNQYKDSSGLLTSATYHQAVQYYESGDFSTSKQLFQSVKDYEDTADYLSDIEIIGAIQGTWEKNYTVSNAPRDILIFHGWIVTDVNYSLGLTVRESKLSIEDGLVAAGTKDEYMMETYQQQGDNSLWERNHVNEEDKSQDIFIEYRKRNSSTVVPSPPAIGMTRDEVINSLWGKPNQINKTTTANGVSEQWVYSDDVGGGYVYFEDGIVESIQE